MVQRSETDFNSLDKRIQQGLDLTAAKCETLAETLQQSFEAERSHSATIYRQHEEATNAVVQDMELRQQNAQAKHAGQMQRLFDKSSADVRAEMADVHKKVIDNGLQQEAFMEELRDKCKSTIGYIEENTGYCTFGISCRGVEAAILFLRGGPQSRWNMWWYVVDVLRNIFQRHLHGQHIPQRDANQLQNIMLNSFMQKQKAQKVIADAPRRDAPRRDDHYYRPHNSAYGGRRGDDRNRDRRYGSRSRSPKRSRSRNSYKSSGCRDNHYRSGSRR